MLQASGVPLRTPRAWQGAPPAGEFFEFHGGNVLYMLQTPSVPLLTPWAWQGAPSAREFLDFLWRNVFYMLTLSGVPLLTPRAVITARSQGAGRSSWPPTSFF